MKPAARSAVSSPKPRRELVRQELLTKAAEIFEAKGYAQATIQDVAESLDMSRSSLYHYFQSKDDILLALVEEHANTAADRLADTIERVDGNALDRLKVVLASSIENRTSGGARLRALDQLAGEMPAGIKEVFESSRRRVLDYYIGLLERGIEEGIVRPVDPRLAAFAILGIVSWPSWWYSPSGRNTPQEIAAALVDVALNGIAAASDRGVVPTSPQGAIDDIRRSLDSIERMVR